MAKQTGKPMVRLADVQLSDYLTTQQAAVMIGCTDRYVRRLRDDGAFGSGVVQLGPRSFLLPFKAVEKIANEQHKVGRPRKNSA